MIVLDASIAVELLTNGDLADELRRDLALRAEPLAVPHLLDVEVLTALRSLAAAGRIDSHRADEYLRGLAMIPAERFPHSGLLQRVCELRHNFTAYDAVYIALAEALKATLYTTDEKLRRGHRASVVIAVAR